MSLSTYIDVPINDNIRIDATNNIRFGPAGLIGADALLSVTNAGVCS